MKIGVISDTHLAKPNEALHRIATDVFDDVEIVLHAGDLTRMAILDVFSGKKMFAVRGNRDRREVRENLPAQETISVDGYRIGLIHGWGGARNIDERILDRFDKVHALVFGHTHKAANHIHRGVLMFNPGAFSGSFLLGRSPSVGVLTIDEGISGTIIKI